MSDRIKKIFLNKNKKLISFTTGGDPNLEMSIKTIECIISNDIDIVEIGMPFSDPMADGPTIQLSSARAIKNGINLSQIFEIVKHIRTKNKNIPIVLMGYYNVIFHFGIKEFVQECKKSGVDGLIIVDLQPEEDQNLYNELLLNNIDLIRLITPTTNKKRLKSILVNASGFLYYVTITGITGQHSADINELKKSIEFVRNYTSLPIVAGFGIKNAKDVKEICDITDGAVVGSSIVKIIEENQDDKNKMLKLINKFTKELKKATI